MTDRTDELAEARAAIERVRELASSWVGEADDISEYPDDRTITRIACGLVIRRALDGGEQL